MSKNLYVSEYGNWGTEKVGMFDTTNWLEKDWEKLDGELDHAKLDFARYISRKRNKQARRAQELLEGLQTMEVRTFIITPDGVEEV